MHRLEVWNRLERTRLPSAKSTWTEAISSGHDWNVAELHQAGAEALAYRPTRSSPKQRRQGARSTLGDDQIKEEAPVSHGSDVKTAAESRRGGGCPRGVRQRPPAQHHRSVAAPSHLAWLFTTQSWTSDRYGGRHDRAEAKTNVALPGGSSSAMASWPVAAPRGGILQRGRTFPDILLQRNLKV
jgi:hypothetical protein